MSNFPENLSRLLKEKNISQLKLATDLNLSPPSISRYCTGLQLPRADVIALIAKYLNVSTDTLLGIDKNISEDFRNQSRKSLMDILVNDYLDVPRNMISVLLEKLSDEEIQQVLDFIYYLLSKHKEYQNLPNTKGTQ